MSAVTLDAPKSANTPIAPSSQRDTTKLQKDTVASHSAACEGLIRLPDGVEEAPTMDNAAALGAAVWLIAQSAVHQHTFVADLTWMVMPPIELGQFKLYRIGAQPFAFAAWAKISHAAEFRLNCVTPRLAPADWASGDIHWLIHLICPFGKQEDLMRVLCQTPPLKNGFKFHRTNADGKLIVDTTYNQK